MQRWEHLLEPGSQVLDVACGSGRHLRWLASRGHRVTGVDRDALALEPLRAWGDVVVADIENGPWPFAGRCFDAVVVTNYLWRPLLPTIVASLADDGVLLYETFALGQERYGRPANPQFLLRPGELLEAAAGLRIVAYEDGLDAPAGGGETRCVQRLAACRQGERAGTAKIPRLSKDTP